MATAIDAKIRKTVPATDFAKNFGEYRVAAQRCPVAVSSNGKLSGYFVAAEDYELMVRAMAHATNSEMFKEVVSRLLEPVPASRRIEPVPGRNQQAHWIADLGPDFADALENTTMDKAFDRLNTLPEK